MDSAVKLVLMVLKPSRYPRLLNFKHLATEAFKLRFDAGAKAVSPNCVADASEPEVV